MTDERRENLKVPILQYFKDIKFCMNNCLAYDSLNNMLDNLIEASEERPQGKWKKADKNICRCSNCGYLVSEEHMTLYCCNCGSEMEVDL